MLRVQVFGTFDHFHLGHKFLLDEAHKCGQVFITVALDETVERIKGSLPDTPLAERIAVLQKQYPDAVIFAGSNTSYIDSVTKVLPDMLFLGYDQQLPPNVTFDDIDIPIERCDAFEPEKYKSSLLRVSK